MLQSLENRGNVLTCGYCMGFLGSVQLQFKYLQRLVSRQDEDLLKSDQDQDKDKDKDKDKDQDKDRSTINEDNILHDRMTLHVVPCKYGCGEFYCSEDCRDIHWERKGHKWLCTGPVREDEIETHPLIKFKVHATQTNEIFLMVANLFANIVQEAEDSIRKTPSLLIDQALRAASAPYEGYVRQDWWDAAVAPSKKVA